MYGRQLNDGNLVRFNALHFVGNAKGVMHRYYTGEGLLLQKVFSEVYNDLYSPLRKKLWHHP